MLALAVGTSRDFSLSGHVIKSRLGKTLRFGEQTEANEISPKQKAIFVG